MIQPQYWSLMTLYYRWKYGKYVNSEYPSLDVQDKVVLDVGAADGDTARWWFKHGARHVICIEKNPSQARKIKMENTTVLNEYFKLDHLKLYHDCMKMDIEGYEALLLPYLDAGGKLKPTAMEVHNWYLVEQFTRHGFRPVTSPDPMLGTCVMVNYPV